MIPWGLVADFLSLFIPAAIGISGSFYIYTEKQKRREENLRSAFLAEIGGNEFLEKWPIEGGTVPAFNFLSLSVYDANSGDLALLDNREVSALVKYYTRAKTVREALDFHTEVIARTQAASFGSDVKSSDREEAIRVLIDKLELSRQRALLILQSDPVKLPKEGDTISKWDSLKETTPLLIDYGFAREIEDRIVLTSSGEEFFAGEMILTGHQKENDTLDRDKSLFRRTWERRYHRIKKFLSRLYHD